MAKKLSDIKKLVDSSASPFLDFLNKGVDNDVLKLLYSLTNYTDVYIFSGIIRNYFLESNTIRDIDIVLSQEIDVLSFFKDFHVKPNSFGGYKINVKNTTIDLWFLENTWAFKHQKTLNFELEKQIPSTAFFNFSSIIFSLKEKSFFYRKDFLRFLRDKKIDVVFKPNANNSLCIINTFYYSDKYHLKIAKKLKDHIKYLQNINSQNHEETQLKHFGEILFTNDEIELRLNTL